MILIDTHTLIWYLTDQKKLSSKVLDLIKSEIKNGEVLYSSISVWEVCILVKKKKLNLSKDINEWVANLKFLPNFRSIPVNNEIGSKSVLMEGFKNPDPADRIIIATALSLGCSIATKDSKIHAYKMVKCVW